LFGTDTWHQLQKNAPEFEELAAMQAGSGQIIARRDKTQESARSVTGEFVSGNYFRTFGLQLQIGRLFTDADNVEGAPFVAIISYDMWQNNYAGDSSVVGSTFWINTKAVTITGIAPKGFYGDIMRPSSCSAIDSGSSASPATPPSSASPSRSRGISTRSSGWRASRLPRSRRNP
jgi:hypothetical protein